MKNFWKVVWKYARAWFLVSVIVIAFFFTATMVATQNDFLAGTLDTVLGGEGRRNVSGDPNDYKYYEKTTEGFAQFNPDLNLSSDVISNRSDKEKVLKQANLLNEEIVGEGIVLLKNKGEADSAALPLKKGAKISVFGKSSANIVLGGSGSGGGNTKNSVSLYDGLKNAGFELNSKLVSFYESNASGSGRDKNPAIGAKVTGLAIGETPQEKYTDDIKNSYSSYKDAAIIVFSRIGGEGFDLPRLQKTDYNGSKVAGAKEDAHYLELDINEEALLNAVIDSHAFDKVVVLINCATSMELGFIEDNDGIDAALWIGSPGGSGANSIGKILCGDINPSGRLVDTYVRDFTKDPTWQNFGDNLSNGGNAYLAAGSRLGSYYVEYEESIYLGYRYYETRSNQEIYRFGDDGGWYDENVVYPFGFGKSYANFEWSIVNDQTTASGTALTADGTIDVTVKVKNVSTKYSGKDVVQLYFSAPYVANGIEKAHVILGGAVKTAILAPGEEKSYKISLSVREMASYDYTDANANGFKGYELDMGKYTLYIGRNAHECWAGDDVLSLEYIANETITYPYDIYDEGSTNDNKFQSMSDYMSGKTMSRSNFSLTFPKTPTTAEREISETVRAALKYKYDDANANYVKTFENVALGEQGKSGNAPQLYELIGEPYDSEKWDEIINYLTIEDMVNLVGQANFHTNGFDKIGKPRTIDPDGPAGYTNFMGDPTVHDTCFYASECIIGATWNKDLAHDMGVMVGLESLVGYTNGDGRTYSGWYAPAVNIHRSPFSGRNWEYYSEDPFLAGMMGTEVVKGAQSKGVYTFVKHFVLNDQETNRDADGLITWADEQAFREIYLKPFKMIVENGNTHAMMSSFNRIGTDWAGGSYALLTEVLRKEWGFVGMVISDYNLSNGYMPPDQMIRAGGDINLSQDYKPSNPSSVKEGMTEEMQIKALRLATKNVLYTIANSNAMNGMGEGVVWASTMAIWKVLLIVINIALVLLAALWGFFAIRKGYKKLAAEGAASSAPAEEVPADSTPAEEAAEDAPVEEKEE